MAGNKAKSHEPAASSPSQFLKSGQEMEKVEGQVEDFLPCHAGPYPSHAALPRVCAAFPCPSPHPHPCPPQAQPGSSSPPSQSGADGYTTP